MKPVRFTPHALEKLKRMQEWGVTIDENTVVDAVLRPNEVFSGYLGRSIAQTVLDEEHVLRVVYEEGEDITVITLYPGRRGRYED